MKHLKAVDMLSALAHDTRLTIFKMLVRQGPEGLAAGKISKRLKKASSTVSFHLAHLTQANLVKAERDGRSIIYRADYESINAVIGYLMDNCCKGDL
ncbi:MAG TPA: metalloregulator ArsR/SmtB family transcription factor [Candidatus Melainabacteria bacterium]|nr:metalloregulator ArsR/SmtB family transcription factor [Candidatus Melainabacteria bacterium]